MPFPVGARYIVPLIPWDNEKTDVKIRPLRCAEIFLGHDNIVPLHTVIPRNSSSSSIPQQR